MIGYDFSINSEPYPLITDTIKSLRIKLAELEWENIDDIDTIDKIKYEIEQWLFAISLGEKYHVPF
jgi:hypothetical protein